MKFLELRVPPVIVAAIFSGLIFRTAEWLPGFGMSVQARSFFSLLFIGLAGLFGLAGLWSFNKAKTSVNPFTPELSSNLVSNGIYRYTRNPMYVGLAFVLDALCIGLDNLYTIALVALFMWYMTAFQIKPEERELLNVFGEEFKDYMSKTRRWL